MRVVTVPVAMAVTPREVFDGCDAEVVLAVLLHKLIQAAGKVCSPPSLAPLVYGPTRLRAYVWNFCTS